MKTRFVLALAACSSALYGLAAAQVDTKWYAPAKNEINNLDKVPTAKGVYGFIYNSSDTPRNEPCVSSWCNMPHVRRAEYVQASAEYELKYVELIHRHHKRTPYSSNAFPVESYQWNCNDSTLYYYGQPLDGSNASRAYQETFISPVNPFVPKGWIGTCKFPQITAEGLEDSWQHGADLYHVYHDLLGFLPPRGSAGLPPSVKYRVTNNLITSQVAGMVINGMWGITDPVPILVQARGVDSLEPQYPCKASVGLFSTIKSDANPEWRLHLERASSLYQKLDGISGVPSNDTGFHESLDHYYDNLSARQCHAKPLPCELVGGPNSTECVDQELADAVYRWGHWEYSQIYRDSPASLEASVGSFGVWIAELTAHMRDVIAGKNATIYYHNVAHDGSVSRLLSILQIEQMIWPGMGSEVVFEIYQKAQSNPANLEPMAEMSTPSCHRGDCPSHSMPRQSTTTTLPSCCESVTAVFSSSSECDDSEEIITSACSCPDTAADAATSSAESASESVGSGYYVRVLFGGQVLCSSSPTLGLMDMLPIERLISYFDGLVGKKASKVKAQCEATK